MDVAQHACGQWLEQIAAQMVRVSAATAIRWQPDSMLLAPQPEDLAEATERLQAAHIDPTRQPPRFVLVHPGSGGLHKCYPIEQYLRLCRLLRERSLAPVMVLGPAELDRWGERMSQLVRHCTLIADPPLQQLLALAQLAAAYVGNDSGPTHVAAATGAATLALFGPTDPQVWRPLGPRVRLLQSKEHERGWTDLPAETVAQQLTECLDA